MPMTALAILLATAGLAALAFTLLFIHVASVSRDAFDEVARAELCAFYLADEADTEPLPNASVARSGDNLGEQRA